MKTHAEARRELLMCQSVDQAIETGEAVHCTGLDAIFLPDVALLEALSNNETDGPFLTRDPHRDIKLSPGGGRTVWALTQWSQR